MNSGFHLLAESGSSKTEWFLFSERETIAVFQTAGINPDVQQDQHILRTLQSELLPGLKNQKPEVLHYYGAGLRNPVNRERMESLFFMLFGKIKTGIEHDLLGAARALFGQSPGIACILGTGSNSCCFDGKNILKERGGNGFLFGDEGSGADLGKALIKKALDEDLEPMLVDAMEHFAGKKLLEIRRSVHLALKMNVALASWAPFIQQHIQYTEIREMVIERFILFIQKTILKYQEGKTLRAGFTGSVAHYFKKELLEACEKTGINPGLILQKPGEALMQFHLKNDN